MFLNHNFWLRRDYKLKTFFNSDTYYTTIFSISYINSLHKIPIEIGTEQRIL